MFRAKWVVAAMCSLSALFVVYTLYNKREELSEQDRALVEKYQYQIRGGVTSHAMVKRSMAKFGDRRLIPYVFPGQDANQVIPDKKKRSAKKKRAGEDWSAEYKEAKPITVNFPLDVFVRIRPLIAHEVDSNHEKLQFKITSAKKKKQKGKKGNKKKVTKTLCVVKQQSQRRDQNFDGLSDVLLPEHDNEATFQLCIVPCIDRLFAGEMCAAFAFGHSGSGKTHTMFGYKNEPGLHALFVRESMRRLQTLEHGMFLEVRFVELYRKEMRDLLSADKREVLLRQSERRGFVFRSKPVLCEDGKFRCYPPTAIRVESEDQLRRVLDKAVASRNVGTSTIHDQSSRSHAFLEYEVVNDALCEKRKELMHREADLLWYQLMKDEIEAQRMGKKGSFIDRAPDAFKEEMQLYTELTEKWKLQTIVGRLEGEVDMFYVYEFPKIVAAHPALSKVMCFVDLAGNEYGRDVMGKEDAQTKRERVQINADLMALKECVRALHGKNRKHIPYRQSAVTQYLKRFLGEEDTKAVMISTIGLSQQMLKQSVNTLKYARLCANA